MRKIIVTELITLDGVVEAPGGNETPHPHGGWQFKYRNAEGGKYKMDELGSADACYWVKTRMNCLQRTGPARAVMLSPTE